MTEQGKRPARLSGRTLGLLFEKPSLRTRVSFEAAISRLGGDAIFLRGEDVGLGIRESVADFARVLSQYVDAFAVRTFAHSTVEELARHATRARHQCAFPLVPPVPGDGRPDDDPGVARAARGQEAALHRRRQQRRDVARRRLGPARRAFRAGRPQGLRVSDRLSNAIRRPVSHRSR